MTHIPRDVRQQVRQRANFRCEYCRLPEGFGFYTHQVDHIRALKHRGPSSLENYAWACFDCNNGKGSDLASYDEDSGQIVPLFNPRTQTWEDHFDLMNGSIIGKTPVGRVTVYLLQMNHEEQIKTRRYLIAANLW